MIPVIDESLQEINELRKEIQRANQAKDWERLFSLSLQLEKAVHRFNHGGEE